MKIDQEYMRGLLAACHASEKPTFDIEDLQAAGFDYEEDPRFEFHMKILNEQGFIEQDDGDPGFGLIKSIDGHASWAVVPLRLTASGHGFIEALTNNEVWATIKTSFKDASISTLKTVATKLLEAYTVRTIGHLIG